MSQVLHDERGPAREVLGEEVWGQGELSGRCGETGQGVVREGVGKLSGQGLRVKPEAVRV